MDLALIALLGIVAAGLTWRLRVLLASALKLLDVTTTYTAVTLGALVVLAGPIWMALRRAHGFPALPANERRDGVEQATVSS